MKTWTVYSESYDSMNVNRIEAETAEDAAITVAQLHRIAGPYHVHEGPPIVIDIRERHTYEAKREDIK